ncbi:MAG: hypothetical protein QOH76_3698 [Thermoleophilaceae bacterium]|jgi:hypothetical protein|nr:hypothetical protein [Thermoleophilaceae bacterium]
MAALMGAGAFGVHQLRFAITYEDGQALNGHGYLAPVGAVLVGLLLYAFASCLARLARGVAEEAPRFRRLWAGASASLVTVYCVQESLEGLLTSGHSVAMFQHGGWVSVPLALAVGMAIALVMRGAVAASEVAAVARGPRVGTATAAPCEAVLPPWTVRRSGTIVRRLASRGPPSASA